MSDNLHEEDREVSFREQTSSNSNVEEGNQGLDDTLPHGWEGDQSLTNEEAVLRFREEIDSIHFSMAMA
jgi:hypothetical protein